MPSYVLEHIDIEVNHRCNLACRHCSARAAKGRSVEELSEDEAQEYFLLPDGVRSIKITSIRFKSGHRIVALPHSPRKLRGKGGVYCLDEAMIRLIDIDYVVFYDKPLVKFERLLETYLAYAPKGIRSFVSAMPIWLKEKLFLKY